MLVGCIGRKSNKFYESDEDVKIDIDLTQMHSLSAYFNAREIINTNPEDYEGKIIKFIGKFNIYENKDMYESEI